METDPNPLLHGCDDSWTWDRHKRSPEVRLYSNYRIAHFHPNWSSSSAGVRGTKILNNGCYFWELHINKRLFGTSMMFGVGTAEAKLHADTFTNLLGEDAHGWGLSHKGLLWHAGNCQHYTKPFRENFPTKIGLLFNGINGTLSYYKDDKYLGVAFRGLNDIKEPLFPIICSTAAKTEVCLGKTRRDFVNLQDRCRAAIVKRLKDKHDLDKLFMPKRLKKYLSEGIQDRVRPLRLISNNRSLINYV